VIDNQDQYTEQIDLICQATRRFVEKKKYKYVVFGHTYYPIIGGKLVNCGDMVDSCSYVIIEDGMPKLMKI
jgi:hypothetical protein